MSKSSWSAVILADGISVPVKGFEAIDERKARVIWRQLHDACHSRIRQSKLCPLHGPVNSGQIVKGYQYAPDQYAVFTAAETQQFQAAPGRAISVSRFFGWGTIDPLYFSGRHYFLLPAHRRAQQPYAALHQAMLDEQVWGLAEMVIAQREKLVVIRPLKRLLSVSVIHYAAAIRSVADLYAELDDRPMMPQELTRAKTSINALRAELPRLGQFHDPYIERVMAQIEAKIAAGKAASSRLWTAVSRRERT